MTQKSPPQASNSSPMRTLPPLAVLLQYLMPKRWLTQAFGCFAQARLGSITTWSIRHFIKRYAVDMREATQANPSQYSRFNDFFIRALSPQARPLAHAPLICPVDGCVSQLGRVQQAQLLQAKGHTYTCSALLGQADDSAAQWEGAYYACLYLSPKDYHRVHMPCAGTLRRMVYIPGSLFSVNPLTARFIPNLFARNERVVCWFDTEWGPLVMVLVGATIVGSIATTWHGVVTPTRRQRGQMQAWDYPSAGEGSHHFEQGQEMGHFQLGSTVVFLLSPQSAGAESKLQFSQDWQPEFAVRMGQVMLQEGLPLGEEKA